MARSTLTFETGAEAGIKTIQKIVPVDIFLAAGITDGEGKKSNRILFRAQGGKQFYFMFPRGTEENMRPAAPWLQEIMAREVVGTHAPIPEDPIAVSTGDPLED